MRGVCSPFERYLYDLHARFEGLCSGNVATYIPELARANPDWFGICIVTVDGRTYEVGDTRQTFTIQSISKPLAYGLALDTHGLVRSRPRSAWSPAAKPSTPSVWNRVPAARETR